MYCIVDIETTGGKPRFCRIIEIAIYKWSNGEIVEEFQSLVNPETEIPPFIQQLTGIKNKDVINAPTFSQISHRVEEILLNSIFVAHNVNFDYSIVRRELQEEGIILDMQKLCTVELSQKVIPGKESYSLGKLCKSLNIEVENRHRAAGDALATTKLLELLIENGAQEEIERSLENRNWKKSLPSHMSVEDINSLPRESGLIYMHNDKGKCLFLKDSNDIQQTMVQLILTSKKNQRKKQLLKASADIDFEIIDQELIRLISKHEALYKIRPKYNRIPRLSSKSVGLFAGLNNNGFPFFYVAPLSSSNSAEPLGIYKEEASAYQSIRRRIKANLLCDTFHLENQEITACNRYKSNACSGACTGKVSVQDYQRIFEKAVEHYKKIEDNMLVIEKVNGTDEVGVIYFKNRRLIGWNVLAPEFVSDSTMLLESMKPLKPSHYLDEKAKQIIRNQKHRLKLIPIREENS